MGFDSSDLKRRSNLNCLGLVFVSVFVLVIAFSFSGWDEIGPTWIVPLVRCMMIALGVLIHLLICGIALEDVVRTTPGRPLRPPSPPSVRFSSMYCNGGNGQNDQDQNGINSWCGSLHDRRMGLSRDKKLCEESPGRRTTTTTASTTSTTATTTTTSTTTTTTRTTTTTATTAMTTTCEK